MLLLSVIQSLAAVKIISNLCPEQYRFRTWPDCVNPFLLTRQSPNNEAKIEQDPSRTPIQTLTQLLKSMSKLESSE
jgi:hypothetical protein